MARYKVSKGSRSGHCCFEYTVIDSAINNQWDKGHTMCETFSEEDALTIQMALNYYTKKKDTD